MHEKDKKYVSALSKLDKDYLLKLSHKLSEYYNSSVVTEYYNAAHSINKIWSEDSYHSFIKKHIEEGSNVLDVGCGSAHAYLNLIDLGVTYTGVDWSSEIIDQNKLNYPDANFIEASLYSIPAQSNSFDVVFSFYVLEHLVYPNLFLKELHRLVKPGGKIIILCPNFRSKGRISSLKYGKVNMTLKNRILKGNIFDSFRHLFLRNFYYPVFFKFKFPVDSFPFLINLKPSCLEGDYYADNDAVYFVDTNEVKKELENIGSVTVFSSDTNTTPRINNNTCLIISIKN